MVLSIFFENNGKNTYRIFFISLPNFLHKR